MQPQAFDTYALSYDEHFTHSLVGKVQRRQVYRSLLNVLSQKTKNVLELNCGTGHDALWLSQRGLKVLATDISEGMLEAARQKDKYERVEFRKLRIQDIGELQPNKYDLIFSNFGGLNCLDPNELKDLKAACDNLQNPSGKVAFVIMSENCFWEKTYYNFKGDHEKAKRRKNKNGVDTRIDGVLFKTFYYKPQQIKELFGSSYSLVAIKPIGLFVPPSYLEAYFGKRRLLFKLLCLLDDRLGFSFLANYADHFLIILEKK